MEHLCPLCNGFYKYKINCKICRNTMEDRGRIQDYYDDYSPYLNYSITDVMDDEPSGICQHLFICTRCFYDEVVNIRKIFM